MKFDPHPPETFLPPMRSPQGGAKIAQGGAKISRALRAREDLFRFAPPELFSLSAPALYVQKITYYCLQ